LTRRLVKLAIAAAVFVAALVIGHSNASASSCPPFCLDPGRVVQPAPVLAPWHPGRRGNVIAE